MPLDRFITASDGTGLHYRVHLPDEGTLPLANLLVIHGAGEYADRYDEFASFGSIKRGVAVYALDLRGFGQSGGPRAYTPSFARLAEDIHTLTRYIKKDRPETPLFLLGHSMGGLIAAYYASEYSHTDTLSGLILSSPCFNLAFKLPYLTLMMGKIINLVYPKFLFKTAPVSQLLTHDKEIVKRHQNDERICRQMSAGLFHQMKKQMARKTKIAKLIKIPTAIFQAGDDRIVSSETAKAFADLLPDELSEFTLYPNLYHEILQETSRETVFTDIYDWLGRHCR